MTLKELINSEPLNANRTNQEVFDWLLEGSGQYQSTLVNARQLMSRFGAQKAADFLDKLDAVNNNVVKWAMKFMVTDGIDVGDRQIREMLDKLVTAGVIENVERNAVKGLATEISRWQAAGLRAIPNPAEIPAIRKT